MYTVKELIEALSKCPEDYEVNIRVDWETFGLETIGIDHDNQTVDLFAE